MPEIIQDGDGETCFIDGDSETVFIDGDGDLIDCGAEGTQTIVGSLFADTDTLRANTVTRTGTGWFIKA